VIADNLIVLREGAGPSIVFVHPASGLATAFRRMVSHLAGTGAILAFENAEPEGLPPSISELAAMYWEQLKDVATDPFIFVGWSFGGTIALELSSLAKSSAREVTAVVLLDAGAPHLLSSSSRLPILDLAGLFGISSSDLQGAAPPTSDTEALDIILDALRRTRGIAHIEAADVQPFIAAYRWHYTVGRRPWTFKGHRAPVFLFRAQDEAGWSDAPLDLGWTSVLGAPPAMSWTSGTHHSLMSEEHAPNLARLLSVTLAKVQEAPSNFYGDETT
jgi:thioesterase domain-containing protein